MFSADVLAGAAFETVRICVPTILDGWLGRVDARVCDQRLASWSKNLVELVRRHHGESAPTALEVLKGALERTGEITDADRREAAERSGLPEATVRIGVVAAGFEETWSAAIPLSEEAEAVGPPVVLVRTRDAQR